MKKYYEFIMDIVIHLGFWFAFAMMIAMSVIVYKEFKEYPTRQVQRMYKNCYDDCVDKGYDNCLELCVPIYNERTI